MGGGRGGHLAGPGGAHEGGEDARTEGPGAVAQQLQHVLAAVLPDAAVVLPALRLRHILCPAHPTRFSRVCMKGGRGGGGGCCAIPSGNVMKSICLNHRPYWFENIDPTLN